MFRDNFFRELVIDNFAGGGGASVGMELALGSPVDIAINHDPDAIAMHKINHPYTLHLQEDVFAVDPEKVTGGRSVGVAWFSPCCTHFSRAKGGTPVTKQLRGLSWVVLKWALSQVAPRVIFIENVPEFTSWGPLVERDGKFYPDPEHAGELFRGFVAMLSDGIDRNNPAFLEACEFIGISPDSSAAERLAKGLKYATDWKVLKACDYGSPTNRKRFYLVARRDGLPVTFPAPTHGKGRGLKPYRTAAECIDFSVSCPSIFDRDKPLVDNTLKRLAKGLEKLVVNNPQPFIIEMNFANAAQSLFKPMTTQTSANHHYFVTPFLAQYHSAKKGEFRGQSIGAPLLTVDTSPRYALAMPFLTKYFSGKRQAGASLDEPMPTVTAIDHNALVETHLCVLRKNMDCKPLDAPMPTITTNQHLAQATTVLQTVNCQSLGRWEQVRELLNRYTSTHFRDDEILLFRINGELYFIADIGMRMLLPEELKKAQGFPDDYIIDFETSAGKRYSKAKQIARLGNAVCPSVATALVRSNCAELCPTTQIATMQQLESVISAW